MSREVFRHLAVPFPDGVFPLELGAVVQQTVLDGSMPALEVIHTNENSWLVGDGVNDPNEPGACVVACIWHVIEHNSSVASLASLPVGHVATRSGRGQPWDITVHEWPRDDEDGVPVHFG
jgi:hypothetical protein